MKYLKSLLSIIAMVAATAANATSSAACQSPEHHQLDFWVGDWDVYDVPASGKPADHVTVTSLLDKCVIHELYEGDSGLRGESFSIYDAPRKVWHQTWVSNRGELLIIEGGMREGRLMLAGHQVMKDNQQREIRAYWWKDKDGVRESSESSTDGGKTWSPDFNIVFKPHRAK